MQNTFNNGEKKESTLSPLKTSNFLEREPKIKLKNELKKILNLPKNSQRHQDNDAPSFFMTTQKLKELPPIDRDYDMKFPHTDSLRDRNRHSPTPTRFEYNPPREVVSPIKQDHARTSRSPDNEANYSVDYKRISPTRDKNYVRIRRSIVQGIKDIDIDQYKADRYSVSPTKNAALEDKSLRIATNKNIRNREPETNAYRDVTGKRN